jgi:hypothetical protein
MSHANCRSNHTNGAVERKQATIIAKPERAADRCQCTTRQLVVYYHIMHQAHQSLPYHFAVQAIEYPLIGPGLNSHALTMSVATRSNQLEVLGLHVQ